MLMYAIMPILLALGSTAVWSLIYWIRKNNQIVSSKKYGRIVASVIILFFLVHPNILQYMFNNFNCKEVDSDQRVQYDLEVICWDSEHTRYSLFIAVPSIIIWGFGIPIFAWIILAHNKGTLDKIESREKYGFLYNGYKRKYYFWESVNMFRKIIIIFISVFLSVAGTITQALVVFLTLILFLYLNIKIQPFAFPALNDMEQLSLMTSMLTIYCGIFYLSHQPDVYSSSESSCKSEDNGLRLSLASELFFFLVILISNMVFFIYWIYRMYDELKNRIRSKFKKVYLYIF